MNKLGSRTVTGAKYVYLAVFFVLLAGFFNPIINNTSFDSVIAGTLILAMGLIGGVLIYKASTSDARRGVYLGMGLGLVTISLMLVLQVSRSVFG